MWRGNSHNNNNSNHRAWRPNAGGSRRLESTAPARSISNTQRSSLPSATGTNLNARHSATAPVQNGLTSHVNTHARQSLTTPGHNGLSGNSREDWGLMGDSRPPTPSEGRAQYYHRPGPPEQQRTRTYDNGTALTFGPEDPVPEALPGAAFDDQFRQVDAAVRDLQVSNLQVTRAGSSSNAPYQNFRTTRLDLRLAPLAYYPDGYTYPVVPSRYVSVEVLPHMRSLVRHLSELPGSAHPGDSTDTRFGDTRSNSMLQNDPATSEGSQGTIRDTTTQDTVTELENAQRNPNIPRPSEYTEEGPVHVSQGTFNTMRPVPGYPPPLPIPGPSNVTRLVRDINGQLYEVAGYEGGSMQSHPPPPPPPPPPPNVPNISYDIGNHHYPGHGSFPPPPPRNANFNVTTPSENIEEEPARGRTIQRDPGYLRHHRRTAQRGNVLWAQELDDRNNADRARGVPFLGGDTDSGEQLTFLQFQVPREQRAAPEEGLRTPRALSPPRVEITGPSPVAMSRNASGHTRPEPSPATMSRNASGHTRPEPSPAAMSRNASEHTRPEPVQQTGRASAPPTAPAPREPSPSGYFFTPLYQALNAQDNLRRSSLPAIQGRSSSTDSNGENRIFGELAGTVRAPSQEGQGRRLWKKKDAEDEDKDQEKKPRDRRF